MCGIVGFSGRFEPSLLDAMSESVAHRGPDGDGLFFAKEDGVGMAHRRLAIIDLSPMGAQPMRDDFTGVAIVFNGEIYNFQELRIELEADGAHFKGHSDTEVILQCYLARGNSVFGELNGIFAIAIWDPRVRALLLARDGVGVKPLYVAQTAAGVLFASELKALLRYRELDRTLDASAAWSHLTYLWAPTPQTMLKSVRKLEPGHVLSVRDGRIAQTWSFQARPYPTARFIGSSAEAVVAVRESLELAVRRQMVADVEVGSFLSGGLDSSALVAYARPYARDGQLQCFTIETSHSSSEEGFVDDLPYARRVADHLGVKLHTVRVGPEMLDHFERMVHHLDEPQADLAPLNALFICEMARAHGIKVLLSGAGGDDIFSGYRRHFALRQERLWSWFPAAARHALGGIASKLPAGGATLRRVRRALEFAGLDGDDRLISYFYWLPPEQGRRLFTVEASAGLQGWSPANLLKDSLRSIGGENDALNRMLFLEARHFLCDHNLNYTDKMGMAVGVEVRVPFLDPDLMRLAASLPPAFKQHGRQGKWILKRAMEGVLPNDVIYRPKSGFGVPLRRWLRHELRHLVDDLLCPASLWSRGLFSAEAVTELRAADAAGRIDAAYPILALCCIEMWCRLFLDR